MADTDSLERRPVRAFVDELTAEHYSFSFEVEKEKAER